MLSIKSSLAKPFAKRVKKKVLKWVNNPIETQDRVFQDLISEAAGTQFGKDHDFISINNYEDFIKRVPVRDYEALKHYVERVVEGEENILCQATGFYEILSGFLHEKIRADGVKGTFLCRRVLLKL